MMRLRQRQAIWRRPSTLLKEEKTLFSLSFFFGSTLKTMDASFFEALNLETMGASCFEAFILETMHLEL